MSDQLPERYCGRCFFVRNIKDVDLMVSCGVEIPQLPASIIAKKTLMWINQGTDCPAFEPATEQETDDAS